MKEKKHPIPYLCLAIVLSLALALLTACSGKSDTSPSSEPEASSEMSSDASESSEASEQASSESSESPAEISERAMANLLEKLEAANYVIAIEGYRTTSVCSPDLVCFSYAEEGSEDYAYMTLNGETFFATLDEDSVSEVSYYSNEDAVRSALYALPNVWIEATGGNLFELFYNDPEEPLTFVSYDDTVKLTLLTLSGYGEFAASQMHEVYMTLDAEDPTEVRFTAEMDDNPVTRIAYDDLDFTLLFGSAEEDARAAAWLGSPVYPEARTQWTEEDIFFLNSVFLPGYGADAVPFPSFASYALTLDEEIFDTLTEIYYTDAHATESDLADYKRALLDAGFTEETGTVKDGSTATVYRRVLREDYNCYVTVYPHMENGFVLEAFPYYDEPEYTDLAGINEVLASHGFAALPENEAFTNWYAADHAASRTESWLYFFEYDLALLVTVDVPDEEAVSAYLADYTALLTEMGFVSDGADEEEGNTGKYTSADGINVFRSFDPEENTFMMEFRTEKTVDAKEAASMLSAAEIPVPALNDTFLGRDIARYHQITRDFKGQLYLSSTMTFEAAEEAESFLDNYSAALEEAGYLMTNPDNIGTLKEFAYYNEEADKFVSFDYFPNEDAATVNIDFVSN